MINYFLIKQTDKLQSKVRCRDRQGRLESTLDFTESQFLTTIVRIFYALMKYEKGFIDIKKYIYIFLNIYVFIQKPYATLCTGLDDPYNMPYVIKLL